MNTPPDNPLALSRATTNAAVDPEAHLDAATRGALRDEIVATGFPSLDQLLGGGVRRGDLIVIGGDTAMGKSSLALAMALRAAEQGRAVAFLSTETTPERMVERALAAEGRVSTSALRSGSLDDLERRRLAAVALRLRDRTPVWLPLGSAGVDRVADATVEYLGLELVVVDALQALAPGARPLEEELATAVRVLKTIALQRSAAVVVVSHLATTPRDRSDPRPRLEDFGALGAIRQHADVVLGVFREEVYTPSRDVEGAAELHVLKNRSGALGYVDLYFYKAWLRFEDMVEPER